MFLIEHNVDIVHEIYFKTNEKEEEKHYLPGAETCVWNKLLKFRNQLTCTTIRNPEEWIGLERCKFGVLGIANYMNWALSISALGVVNWMN